MVQQCAKGFVRQVWWELWRIGGLASLAICAGENEGAAIEAVISTRRRGDAENNKIDFTAETPRKANAKTGYFDAAGCLSSFAL